MPNSRPALGPSADELHSDIGNAWADDMHGYAGRDRPARSQRKRRPARSTGRAWRHGSAGAARISGRHGSNGRDRAARGAGSGRSGRPARPRGNRLRAILNYRGRHDRRGHERHDRVHVCEPAAHASRMSRPGDDSIRHRIAGCDAGLVPTVGERRRAQHRSAVYRNYNWPAAAPELRNVYHNKRPRRAADWRLPGGQRGDGAKRNGVGDRYARVDRLPSAAGNQRDLHGLRGNGEQRPRRGHG